MSESPSGQDQPPSGQEGGSLSPSPKKKKRSFFTIIKGVFPPSRPTIIPDDLDADSSARFGARTSDGARTQQGAIRATSAPPGRSAQTGNAQQTSQGTVSSGQPVIIGNTASNIGGGKLTFPQSLRQALVEAAPLWLVLLLLALLILLVALVVIPRIQSALAQRTANRSLEAATSTLVQTEYTDDLHAFSVSYVDGEPWVTVPTTSGCVGSIFALDDAGLRSQDSRHPRLRVCFLDFQADQPGKSLNEYLEERLISPMNLRVLVADRGLIRDVEIGTSKTSGRGVHLLGTIDESSPSTKWYVAVANFEGRIYSIEAVSTEKEWVTYWPKFSRLIERIDFKPDVIRPPNTPVVIE